MIHVLLESKAAAVSVQSIPEVMHHLGATRHWDVLARIALGPVCVGELAAGAKVEPYNVSKSLKRWRAYGLVHSRRIKNELIYRLDHRVIVNRIERRIEVTFVAPDGGSIIVTHPLPDSS